MVEVMTEEQMRDAKPPTPGTIEELAQYVDAMSHAAVAAFNYVAHKLGVSGFQASCADMNILSHTRGWEAGRLIDYENLLYPQYRDSIPGFDQYVEEQAEWLAEEARKKLAERGDGASSGVTEWWEQLAAAAPGVEEGK